ncbi:MAG: M20/M25/M40 family metallo-hydrolase [Armatimonadetes bacterium]|nr:M20/M25/M40 family metallo-hydrolase [Armatimonadota bacterium]
MINEDRLLKLFKRLCLINAPSLKERESVDCVKQYLMEIGLDVEEDAAGEKIGGKAGNVIATLKGTAPGAPRVFLSAHFDTVEPTEGLVIDEKGGILFSASDTILGADDKAGMAPAIEAVNALVETGAPHGDVTLLLTVAEEIGLKGADALDIEALGLDYGYVLDTGPPVGTFVTRTATHDRIDVVVQGTPAHSGKNPEDGVSALEVAADAIHHMRLGRIDADTTANFGLIQGGTAVNVVCPILKLRGEARSTSVEKLDAQIDHMVQEFERAARERGATVVIDHDRHYSSFQIDGDSPVVARAQRASAKLGLQQGLRTTLGGSDANIFNAKGVPSIVIATGMDHIHTHDECVSRADLVDTARLAYEILVDVTSG